MIWGAVEVLRTRCHGSHSHQRWVRELFGGRSV